MGIEIPPPKGGPVTFPNQTAPHSPHIPEDERQTPELGEASEHNDVMSLCLSDGGEDFHAVDEWDHLHCMHNYYACWYFFPSTFYQFQTTSILITTINFVFNHL